MAYNNFKTEIIKDLVDNIKNEIQKQKLKKFEEDTNPKKDIKKNDKKSKKNSKTKKKTTNKKNSKNKITKETKKKNIKKSEKKLSLTKKILIITSLVFVTLTGGGLFLLYGPWSYFRELLITTAMTTLHHQYLATWFYDDETIKEVLEKNKVVNSNDVSDLNQITIKKFNKNFKNYANKYEEQILKKNNDSDQYKLIEVNGATYKGYLVAAYDPSKIEIVHSKYLGNQGQLITTMAKDNDALVAINGGGFYDPDWKSQGGIPSGLTINNGEVLYDFKSGGAGELIGFTKDNKLLLGYMTVEQARKNNIEDAIEFGPYLIINGRRTTIYGNGGWGYGPRTVIGQRKDGIVLMLVIDGRRSHSIGASIKDIQDIMFNYGAYNAANLDGGSSSTLVIENKVINNPVASTPSGMRNIPNAIILKK